MTPEVATPFGDFLEAIPDAVVGVDTEGRIVVVNQQTEALFGYSREEMLGQMLEMLVPDRIKIAHPHHRAIYSLSPSKRPMGAGLDLAARHKSGVEFPVDIGLSTMHVDGRRIVLAAVRNMSDRKKYETQFVTTLTDKVEELAGSVDKVAVLFGIEKAQVRQARFKDRVVFGGLIALVLAVGGLAWHTASVNTNAKHSLAVSDRSTCLALNESNGVLRALFVPFNVKVTPTEPPPDATAAQIAALRAADAERQKANDAFFADLERRTAPKNCPQIK